MVRVWYKNGRKVYPLEAVGGGSRVKIQLVDFIVRQLKLTLLLWIIKPGRHVVRWSPWRD